MNKKITESLPDPRLRQGGHARLVKENGKWELVIILERDEEQAVITDPMHYMDETVVSISQLRPHITPEEALRRWPRLTAHQICESLGYFTPLGAAGNIADFKNGDKNHCEYVYSCHQGDPGRPLRRAIKDRHSHKGYMADYKLALALVKQELAGLGDPQMLASWF